MPIARVPRLTRTGLAVPLLTRRLRLRPLTGGDLDDLVELDSDPAVMRFLRTVFLDWPDPLPGTEQGEVEYAMHRSDWQARQRIR